MLLKVRKFNLLRVYAAAGKCMCTGQTTDPDYTLGLCKNDGNARLFYHDTQLEVLATSFYITTQK